MDKLPKNLSDVLLLRELVENYSGVDNWAWTSISDPRNVYQKIEGDNIGRVWFAYTCDEGHVYFHELPKKTINRMREKALLELKREASTLPWE